MKLLHYQANNFHIKFSFNLSGLLLVDCFLTECQMSAQVLNSREVFLGVHIYTLDRQQGNLNVMYVCFVRFQSIPVSDGLFCGLVPSITILVHFVVYPLPTLPPPHSAPWTHDPATLVENLSKMVGNSTRIILATRCS